MNRAFCLPDVGSVTHEEAEAKALGEYEKFWRIQDQTFLSNFDKLIEDLSKQPHYMYNYSEKWNIYCYYTAKK